jgi:4a-hydroxytetrahydrobiopterin dehydratase
VARLVGLEEARRRASAIGPWRVAGRRLHRGIKTRDFAEALRLLNRIARLAEEMEHHPDVEIGYGYLRIRLTTHDAGGLTDLDFKLAERIEETIRRASRAPREASAPRS